MINVTFGERFHLQDFTNPIIPVLDEVENVVGFLSCERDTYNIRLFARRIWVHENRNVRLYGSEETSLRTLCALMDWHPIL